MLYNNIINFIHLYLFHYRYEKCNMCYSHLTSLREDVLRLPKDSTAPSIVIREQGLLSAFAVLD